MMKRILLSHYVSNSKHFITFSYINKTYQDESHEGWYAQSTYFLSPHYHSIKVIVIYIDHANFYISIAKYLAISYLIALHVNKEKCRTFQSITF